MTAEATAGEQVFEKNISKYIPKIFPRAEDILSKIEENVSQAQVVTFMEKFGNMKLMDDIQRKGKRTKLTYVFKEKDK